jgi:Protein of unknown function (DUF4256)
MKHKTLPPETITSLLETLEKRFAKNKENYQNIAWIDIATRLKAKPEKLWSLNEMEKTGGEPNFVFYDKKTAAYLFFDCSPESPIGRRSLCYDSEALAARKEFKPAYNVIDMANEMGIEVLTSDEYKILQQFGSFDTKTSSWLKTPPEIRTLGGAIFGDFRYNHVFIYHNGAASYYAARGFRGLLRV